VQGESSPANRIFIVKFSSYLILFLDFMVTAVVSLLRIDVWLILLLTIYAQFYLCCIISKIKFRANNKWEYSLLNTI
jgi:hypothetical protein